MKKKYLLFILVLTVVGYPVSAKSYNILDFGAIPNELSTKAIQQAVDACYNDGGGTVLVPAGCIIVTGFAKEEDSLVWGEDLPDFFTHGIECLEVKELLIDGFEGYANPGSPMGQKCFLRNTTLR
jgi:hypothetical protein